MSAIRSVLTTGAILVGSSLALLTGGIAKAEPAPIPAPVPEIPGLSMIQQIVNPATAPQLLQAAASMFNPKPATGPLAPAAVPVGLPAGVPAGVSAGAPIAAAPLASAALNMPQAPIAGLPAVGLPALPGLVPAVTPPTLGNSGDLPVSTPLPSGQLNIPNMPGLPVPLPAQLAFPGDLATLLPGAPGASAPVYPAPAAAATSPMPGLGALFPTSALP